MGFPVTGEPIHGELHSTDAHAGVQVPIYKLGSTSAYTLAADEYIEIHSIEVVSAAGGDTYVAVAPTFGGITAGDFVIRGTVSVTGGMLLSRMNFAGVLGGVPWCVSPAGVVDVTFTGSIRRQQEGVRPSFRESLVPGK